MKKFSFKSKVSLLLAAFAVCVIASCFSMPVQAAAGPLTLSEMFAQTRPTTNYIYLESSQNLGTTIPATCLTYSTTDPTVNTGSAISATYAGMNTSNGKYVYLVNKYFSPASTVYLRYQATDVIIAVTAPNNISALYQTGAAANSVTVSWPASQGASGYMVYVGTDSNRQYIGTTAATSYAVGGLTANTEYRINVVPFKSNGKGFNQTWEYRYLTTCTTPGKIKNVKVVASDETKNKYQVQWSQDGADKATGFEIMVVNKNGKKIAMNTETAYLSTVFQNNKMRTQAWKVKVRGYVALSNGTRAYGDWSAVKLVVPNASIQKIKLVNRYSRDVKITWKKVSGAKSYTVYYKSKATGKFKKAATVKGTSYTIKNATKYKNYYVYVQANKVKVGKKKYNSTKIKNTSYGGFYIY